MTARRASRRGRDGGRSTPGARDDPAGRAEQAPGPPSPWEQRVPGPQLPGLISGATLLLGVWLAVAPFVWNYGDTVGVDARWNDLTAGIAIAVLGLVRLVRPIRLITATVPATLLGLWLIIGPFLLDYGYGADSTLATVNDVVVGVIVAGLSLYGYLKARDLAAGDR